MGSLESFCFPPHFFKSLACTVSGTNFLLSSGKILPYIITLEKDNDSSKESINELKIAIITLVCNVL
jgi:hypothetical protein